MRPKIALISVFHKEGIAEFANFLINKGYIIYASGGTSDFLGKVGVKNTNITDLVGGGAILGHKVVTLSREIHAGLLADPNTEMNELEALKIPFIDLVCVDLYPLEDTINSPSATEADILSKTDMGGPALLASAAKGRRIVICDPDDRKKVMDWMEAGESEREEFVRMLAAKADYIVASYRLLSAKYHSKDKYSGITGEQVMTLRYGENAYQVPASWYKNKTKDPLALSNFKIHAGNPSFINMTDTDRALQSLTHIIAGMDLNFGAIPFAGVALKHGNACGASFGETKKEVIEKLIDGNRRSIFGGSVMLNFDIGEEEAEMLVRYNIEGAKRRPLDVVIGSSLSEEAMNILKRQNDRCFVMTCSALGALNKDSLDQSVYRRQIRGGWLTQPNYTFVFDLKNPEIKKYGSASFGEKNEDIILAWAIACTSNSNTISLVKDGMLIANAVGRQDRVGAVDLALKIAKDAGHDAKSATAFSDSFFPFPDAPETLLKAGVSRIVATSGSVNDSLTTDLFKDSKDCELIHIPDKIARGFFGH